MLDPDTMKESKSDVQKSHRNNTDVAEFIECLEKTRSIILDDYLIYCIDDVLNLLR